VNFKKVVRANHHIFFDRTTLLILSRTVYDSDFFLYDAMVSESDLSTLCYDLALGVDDAVFSETDFALDIRLLC